jgi:hypothetical protein
MSKINLPENSGELGGSHYAGELGVGLGNAAELLGAASAQITALNYHCEPTCHRTLHILL